MALIDRCFDSVEKCDLTQVNALYTEMVKKMYFDHRGGAWVESEVVRLRPEIWMCRSVVGSKFASHWSSSLVR